jgi:hypothetical protein
MSFFAWYIWLPSLPLTVGVWLFALRFLSREGGWSELAEVSGKVPSDAFGDPSVRLAEVYVGAVRYASGLYLSKAAEGLAMVGWGPFRLWHPPVYVPTEEIEIEPVEVVRAEGGTRSLAEGDYVRLTLRRKPEVPVHVTRAVARQLRLLGSDNRM